MSEFEPREFERWHVKSSFQDFVRQDDGSWVPEHHKV